LINLFN